MDAFYAALVQSAEEAVLNALVANHDIDRPRRQPYALLAARQGAGGAEGAWVIAG